MGEIPEDIMNAARKLCDVAQHDSWVIETVAEAIKGERERCADIVYLCALDNAPPIRAWRQIVDGHSSPSPKNNPTQVATEDLGQ